MVQSRRRKGEPSERKAEKSIGTIIPFRVRRWGCLPGQKAFLHATLLFQELDVEGVPANDSNGMCRYDQKGALWLKVL